MVSIPTDTIVLPLASEADAERTCDALREYLATGGRIRIVHVIEKAGGAPDKASVTQREERAEGIFEVARERLADADETVETEILYGTDVAETIFDAASAADLLVFSPREASRLSRLLSGDTAMELVTDAPVPVLVLPTPDAEA